MVENGPTIYFSVSELSNQVDERSELWSHPLPSTRHAESPVDESAITIGDYFTAASGFLIENKCSILINAIEILSGTPTTHHDFSRLDICLVKHGAFYHPSMIAVQLKRNDRFILALNLASAIEGNQTIERECASLEKLASVTPDIPRIFGKGLYHLSGGRIVSMFAAEWFEGFYEFHVSRKDDTYKTIVWNTDNGYYHLDDHDSSDIYRRASRLLTQCYNPDTGEQIQPWHHAAGDFVVSRKNGRIDVRLITVRQYTSLFQMTMDHSDDGDTMIEASLIFLINLSIRMRLDRIDGIHDIHWLPDYVVEATVRGFMEGIEHKRSQFLPSLYFHERFSIYLSTIDRNDILEYADMLIHSYHPASPELPLIKANLDRHVDVLHKELKNLNARPL